MSFGRDAGLFAGLGLLDDGDNGDVRLNCSVECDPPLQASGQDVAGITGSLWDFESGEPHFHDMSVWKATVVLRFRS